MLFIRLGELALTLRYVLHVARGGITSSLLYAEPSPYISSTLPRVLLIYLKNCPFTQRVKTGYQDYCKLSLAQVKRKCIEKTTLNSLVLLNNKRRNWMHYSISENSTAYCVDCIQIEIFVAALHCDESTKSAGESAQNCRTYIEIEYILYS